MDSKSKDESKLRRREETLARRVGEALDRERPRDLEACPDAEVLAAYAEQTLGHDESAQWEGHFATCARCRQVLRVLVASADTPLAEKEVAQPGERVVAARAPVEITRRSAESARPGLRDWRVHWIAPAIGVAAVLVVWIAMRGPWRTTDRRASETLIAQAPKEEAPMSPVPQDAERLSKVAPQNGQKSAVAPSTERALSKEVPLNAPADLRAKDRGDAAALDKVSPEADEAKGALPENKQQSSAVNGRDIPTPSESLSLPAPPASPAAPQPRAKAATSAPAATVLQAETNSIAAENAPSADKKSAAAQAQTGEATNGVARQQVAPEARGGARKEQAYAVLRPLQKNSTFLKAPSSSNLWRAGGGGSIQRSTDGGKTWVSQISPSQEDWLAGAAVSSAVCWVVGRNGAIARTIDGDRWEAVAPPAQALGTAAKLPDWTSITATDSQSAVITANDGRKFVTADGGKTWQLQQ
jgi:hypothetical protein